MTKLAVHTCGPQSLIQDLGRFGLLTSGVGHAGAADRAAFALGNRLVGNARSAAGVECLLGGLSVSTDTTVAVAVTGADAPLSIDGIPHAQASTIWLEPGQTLRLGSPTRGLRSYLAVRGGIAVDPVLGSRSTDTLSGIGPAPLSPGDRLPVGDERLPLPPIDFAPVMPPTSDVVELTAILGPRHDWFTDPHALIRGLWQASPQSNRIGVRLDRPAQPTAPPLTRARSGELPTEGVATGSIQVPPSGQPVIFLAGHPVTGGYPLIAVLPDAPIDRAAQIRPGQHLRFRLP